MLVTEASAKGTGRHVLDLAEGMIARGCEVHLLYSPIRMDDAFRKRMWVMPGLNHVSLPMHRSIHPKDLSAAWAVRRYMRQFGPFDIIHGHSSKGGAVARLAAIGSGVPALYTPHALILMAPDLSPLKRMIFGTAEILLSKLSSRIIAVSPEEGRFAVSAGLGKSRIVVIPNGVGAVTLAPRDEARRNCGAGAQEILIGWVGRMVEHKAPDVLVEAFAIARRTAPQLRLAFAGDGPLKQKLADMAARLGIADSVVLLGEVDARKVLPAFDLFAIPSRMEGMPYVALEAMAAGLPIVATVTGGVELLVEPGVNGTLVPTDDRNALAAALAALANDPAMMARMGAASSERVGQFSTERMVERIFSLYEQCAASHEELEAQLAGDLE